MSTPLKTIAVAGFEIAIPGAAGRVRILQWSGLSGRRYDFHWRPESRLHTVRFTDAAEFEKAYADINHTTRRIPSGLGVFHVRFLGEKDALRMREAEEGARRENAASRFAVYLAAGMDPLDDAGLAEAAEEFGLAELLAEAGERVARDRERDRRVAAERDLAEELRRARERPRIPVPVGVRSGERPPEPAEPVIPEDVVPASTTLGIGGEAEGGQVGTGRRGGRGRWNRGKR